MNLNSFALLRQETSDLPRIWPILFHRVLSSSAIAVLNFCSCKCVSTSCNHVVPLRLKTSRSRLWCICNSRRECWRCAQVRVPQFVKDQHRSPLEIPPTFALIFFEIADYLRFLNGVLFERADSSLVFLLSEPASFEWTSESARFYFAIYPFWGNILHHPSWESLFWSTSFSILIWGRGRRYLSDCHNETFDGRGTGEWTN